MSDGKHILILIYNNSKAAPLKYSWARKRSQGIVRESGSGRAVERSAMLEGLGRKIEMQVLLL